MYYSRVFKPHSGPGRKCSLRASVTGYQPLIHYSTCWSRATLSNSVRCWLDRKGSCGTTTDGLSPHWFLSCLSLSRWTLDGLMTSHSHWVADPAITVVYSPDDENDDAISISDDNDDAAGAAKDNTDGDGKQRTTLQLIMQCFSQYWKCLSSTSANW